MVGDLCYRCAESKKFAAFAQSQGLSRYPDPSGERYVYGLDGECAGKKSENISMIDELWDALVFAAKGDESLLIDRS